MERKILPFLCLALMASSSCLHRSGENDPGMRNKEKLSGEITITGAYALSPLIQACADSFLVQFPKAAIQVAPLGSELAIRHLANGKCDLAMVSRPISDREEENFFAVAVARTGVVMVFNTRNPYKDDLLSHGLTIQDLQQVFLGQAGKTWDDFLGKKGNAPIHSYSRQDPCGTAEIIAGFLFMNQSELKGIPVEGETLMIEAIMKDSLGLGYCNINDAFNLVTGQHLPGLEFLPVDLNMNGSIEEREQICFSLDDFQKSICNNTYPFKLSRNLYLVSLQKPEDDLTLGFINWVLTDGQSLIKKLGYSEIPESLLRYNRFLLK